METHMIFETHAHYDDEAFEADREELLDSMQENGIDRIVNACASLESLRTQKLLWKNIRLFYGAFGIHPDDADKMTQETLDEIRRLSVWIRWWQSVRSVWTITGIRGKKSMRIQAEDVSCPA